METKENENNSINSIIKAQLKNSVESYNNFYLIMKYLIQYNELQNEETIKKLSAIIQICKFSGMPLPSGRWGGCLAVALEMHKYLGALFILENSEKFEIDLNSTSSEFGGKNCWNAKDTFELSLLSFDDEELLTNSNTTLTDEHRKIIQNNIDAAQEISNFFKKQKHFNK